MAYNPVSGAAIQYSKDDGSVADGYYLKFYVANTTTPLSMATDATGASTLVKCKLNDKGYPISNELDNDSVFIPHVDQSYRFVLYKTEADADGNVTANADVNIPSIAPMVGSETLGTAAYLDSGTGAANVPTNADGSGLAQLNASNLTAGTVPDVRISSTLSESQAYRQGNILGTVSQSGGVPTGAVIERGSNANGEYAKFADGTLVCTYVRQADLAIAANNTISFQWNFPATFIDTEYTASFIGNPDTDPDFFGCIYYNGNETASKIEPVFRNGATAQNIRRIRCTAIGRWY